jgi:hypothetical protein
MQTSHQNRNQQMPVIGAGRDAIQQQHALETALWTAVVGLFG